MIYLCSILTFATYIRKTSTISLQPMPPSPPPRSVKRGPLPGSLTSWSCSKHSCLEVYNLLDVFICLLTDNIGKSVPESWVKHNNFPRWTCLPEIFKYTLMGCSNTTVFISFSFFFFSLPPFPNLSYFPLQSSFSPSKVLNRS